MYAISVDTPNQSKQFFVQIKKVKFPILSDSDPLSKTLNEYRVKNPTASFAIPATFIIDRDGIIRWHDVGDHKGDRAFSREILPVLEDLSQPPNTPPVISRTIPAQRVDAGQSLVLDLSVYASDEQDDLSALQWEVAPSENAVFTAEINRHQLTIQPLPGVYGSARIRLRLIDSAGETDSQSLLVRVIPAPNTQIEFTLTVPEGLSMFHLPLRVNSVNGAPRTILRISELYDALGGSANVHWLITSSAPTPDAPNEFEPFFGGAIDSIIEAETGIIAALRKEVPLNLVGYLLDGPLRLNEGWNIVGIPHYDSGIHSLSNLAWKNEIQNNATQIAVYVDDGFKASAPNKIFPGYAADHAVNMGQAVMIFMENGATIEFD
jgi:hypothetical protein